MVVATYSSQVHFLSNVFSPTFVSPVVFIVLCIQLHVFYLCGDL